MAGKEEKEDTGDIINSKKVTEATDISGKKKKRRFGMELFLKTEYESRAGGAVREQNGLKNASEVLRMERQGRHREGM